MNDTVPRPRLDPLLAPTDSRPVTLVTAAAGWGKTTAVRDWLTRAPSAAAWLTVDAADDHLLGFWRHAFSSVGAVLPGAGRSGPETSRAAVASDDVLVPALLNAVGHTAVHPIVVIDDLHLIEDRRVHVSLEQLVERAPGMLHLVLVGRRRPALPVGRWRARGVAGEVSEADLAFRRDEAAALLSTFEGLDLDTDIAAWLLDRTEGWSMGLVRVARSLRALQGTPDRQQRAAASTSAVAEYLMREVVDRQSRDIQDFVRATCVVERLNAVLCRELTSRADAQAMLREMEDDNLLVALDNRREWFRYRELLRDVVVTDLERRNPMRLRRLHATAGRWFAAEGDVRLAIAHMLAAGDTTQAFDLAVAAAEAASLQNDPGDWLHAIPPSFVANDPERMARFVVALTLASDFEGAETWLRRAEAQLDTEDLTLQRRRLASMRHQVSALRGDAEGALRDIPPLRQIDADLERDDIVFERLPVNIARSHLVLGEVEAARAMVDLLAAHHNLSEVASLVVVPALRANVEVARGTLSEASRLAERALRHAGLLTPRHFGTLDARLALAAVHLERDQLEAAGIELDRLHELAARLDSTLHASFAELGRVRLAWRRGDFDRAFRHLAEARRCAERSGGPALPHRVDALEAQVRLAAGDRERAAALTASLPESSERALLELRLLADTDRDLAHLRLASLHLSTLRERIVRELLLARTSRTAAASDRHVRRAMELAEPEGFVLVFFEERAQIMPPTPPEPPELEAAAPLSGRQLVVLQRLAGPASNAQIAADLFISKNTLKTHLRSIYRKLGVQSRADAVETARRQDLI